MKLRTEAPVNGGRNYNGPKVNELASLSKIWLFAGKSEYPALRDRQLSDHRPRENVTGADNQQERPAGKQTKREAQGLGRARL